LRNGRRVRAMIAPAVAHRRDLAAIARATADNDRRAFAALAHHRGAIQRLARSQRELAGQVAAVQQQTDQAVIGLVQGIAGLERRVRGIAPPPGTTVTPTSAGAPGRAAAVPAAPRGQLPQARTLQPARQLGRAADVKLLAARAQIQNVTSVVNSLQMTAYGQKGRLLATNNLLLAGNQLFWSLLDPLLQRAGVLNAASATVMAAVAPLGSLLTGQILLAERQIERFATGIATFDGTNRVAVESLRDRIGEQRWPAFRRRTDVPITLTVMGDDPLVALLFQAEVAEGEVRITVREFPATGEGLEKRPLPQARVAWMVDTGADVG
jgi:hypothetical protein